jgi:hypothetical protein
MLLHHHKVKNHRLNHNKSGTISNYISIKMHAIAFEYGLFVSLNLTPLNLGHIDVNAIVSSDI